MGDSNRKRSRHKKSRHSLAKDDHSFGENEKEKVDQPSMEERGGPLKRGEKHSYPKKKKKNQKRKRALVMACPRKRGGSKFKKE